MEITKSNVEKAINYITNLKFPHSYDEYIKNFFGSDNILNELHNSLPDSCLNCNTLILLESIKAKCFLSQIRKLPREYFAYGKPKHLQHKYKRLFTFFQSELLSTLENLEKLL